VHIIPIKEPLSCKHLRTFLRLKLYKHMKGLDEAIGIESLGHGDILGIQPPFVVKEGHAPGSIDRGLIRACYPLLKPLLSNFFGLRSVEFRANSSKIIMVSPKMAHKCLWTSLMKASDPGLCAGYS
jgi:hypothetical protein